MTKIAFAAVIPAALLLAACGNSDSATEAAASDTVEMPAEASLATVPADATVAPDDGAAASASAAASDAAAKPDDVAAAAAAAAADFNDAADTPAPSASPEAK